MIKLIDTGHALFATILVGPFQFVPVVVHFYCLESAYLRLNRQQMIKLNIIIKNIL